MLESVRAAAGALQRRITPSEAGALPREPRTPIEFLAYAELSIRKTIGAFQLIPDFAALSIAHQTTLLQARNSTLIQFARALPLPLRLRVVSCRPLKILVSPRTNASFHFV